MACFNPLRVFVIYACALCKVLLSKPSLLPEALQIFSQNLEGGHSTSIAVRNHAGHRMKLRCIGDEPLIMRKNPRKLLNESLAWIRNNPHATTTDVPQHLIELWSWSDDLEDKPSGWHLCVFGFGFMQHELMTSERSPEEERSVSIDELLERFWQWQMKLGLAEVNQKTEVAIQAMPLWTFVEGEQVVWCRRAKMLRGAT